MGRTFAIAVRALAVWLVLMAVEFLHGAARAVWLVPRIGNFPSRQVGVFTGSILIAAVVYLSVRWLRAPGTASLWAVGMGWLVLTVLFELGFGHYVFGRSWEDLASDFNLARGGLLPAGLVFLAVSPVLAARLRCRGVPPA